MAALLGNEGREISMGTNLKSGIIILVFMVGTVSIAAGRTIYVDDDGPADFNTIQAAIDDSNDGDTIIVADGIYTGEGNRDIYFLGKAITLRSENGPNNCIIDCQGNAEKPHRGFYLRHGEGPSSIVERFLITNGYAHSDKGGGIFCDNSNPTITGCKIEGNYARLKGGGMYNNYSSPSVNDCTFSGNSVYGEGGGMFNYHSNPTVTNCTFIDCSAMHGGGMHNWASSPIVTNCLFSGNSVSGAAGGMFNRDGGSPTVRNCMFIRNYAASQGGGMFNFDGSNSIVSSCMFIGNWSNDGGGMFNSSRHNGPAIYPTVANCTFSGNSATLDGGGIHNRRLAKPILTNCILWANSDNSGMDELAQIYTSDEGGAPVVNYSCIQGGWSGAGSNNIDINPLFIYPPTDQYHLLPSSPCINSGDPSYLAAPDETDIDGDPRVMHGRVDMGADEFTSILEPLIEVSPTEFEFLVEVGIANPDSQILSIRNIGESGTLNWQVVEDCPWLEVEPNSGQSGGEIDMVVVSVDISGMNSGIYSSELTITADSVDNSPQMVSITLHIFDNDGVLHVPSEYGTIQAAIDTAIEGETVIIAEGTYTGDGNRDLDFAGKAITVQSTNPNNPFVVAVTIIDCEGTEEEKHRGFRFDSGESANSVVAGLTITNGYGPSEYAWPYYSSVGGAIFCRDSHPTIKHCNIKNNEASYMGGGMYNKESNPTIIGCMFSDNSSQYGGGMLNRESSPTITDSTFSKNRTHCDGFSNCYSRGGAINNLEYCHVKISNCTFSGNSIFAELAHGGAIRNDYHCSMTITNSIFTDNFLTGRGGAISLYDYSSATITNCTFSGNSAEIKGGAIFINGAGSGGACSATITNSILWGNEAGIGPEVLGSATVSYSNIQEGWAGEGNIDVDPCFVEPGHWEDPCNTPTFPWDDIWIDWDYHLKSQAGRLEPSIQSWIKDDITSPCIDMGNPMNPIGFEPFPNGGRINMGAYGGTTEASKSYFGGPVCEIIVAGDINGDCIVNYKDFALMALNWLRDENQ
ncbi:MAG: choice-of-anchor Q domain-containing protein [Planctomycetota bacterium]|jgi:predicted outer membrane repeat protein